MSSVCLCLCLVVRLLGYPFDVRKEEEGVGLVSREVEGWKVDRFDLSSVGSVGSVGGDVEVVVVGCGLVEVVVVVVVIGS